MTVWQNSSSPISLDKNQIHLWRAHLDLPAIVVNELTNLLSADEIERANKFCFPEHKRRFIVARSILRQLLSNYLHLNPKDLEFAYSNLGKPSIIQSNKISFLQFNLSHSQEYALFGFSNYHLIGVDLEYLRTMSDASKIAERFFSPREFNLISNLPLEQQSQLFFKLWTAKEAYLKAVGTGLSGSLASVDIGLDQNHQTSLLAINGDPMTAQNWSIHSCFPAPNYVATIAINTKITAQQIHFWNWEQNNFS